MCVVWYQLNVIQHLLRKNVAHGRGPVAAVPRGVRLCTVYAIFSVVEMES